MTPLSQVTNNFLSSIVNFNEYQEQTVTVKVHNKSSAKDAEIENFERLLEKLIKEKKLDKSELLKKLQIKEFAP